MLHPVLVSPEGLLGEGSQTKVMHPCSDSKVQANSWQFKYPQGERKLSGGNKKDSEHLPKHFAGDRIAPMPESLLGGMKFLISSDKIF